jgi:hypothetical protein
MQTCVPVAQLSTPPWHGLLIGVQLPPALHGTHAPLLHTMPAPHELPSARFEPASLHTGPLVQLIVPARHGLLGTQLALVVHATHASFMSHTIPVPHDVPAERGVPVS